MNDQDPLLQDTAEDLYEFAPCGYLSTWPDGRIAKVNATLLKWLEYERQDILGRRFSDLLTGGGRIHYETHFAPLLLTAGSIDSAALDFLDAHGNRLPVFITANTRTGPDGAPALIRITALDARERRSYERELISERRRAELERERVQVLASTLQRSLLPPSLSPPAGVDADAYYHFASAFDVGGDFYDLFPLTDDRWGFFLGDVCGKGPEAAVVTSSTRYTLRAAAVYDRDPIAVLHKLNSLLLQEFASESKFCTVLFGVITLVDGGLDVDIASGGHPPALLLRADGTAQYLDTRGGQLVGILPEPHFVATHVRLAPGDTVVLYSDGLTEARTGVGRARYDDTGALLDFAVAHAPSTTSDIVAALKSLMESFGSGLEDDAAIMAFGLPREDP